MIITRKIELRPLGETLEKKNAAWKFLRDLTRSVCRAYNRVVSNQYFNQILTERIRKSDEDLAKKDAELENDIAELTKQIRACKDKDEKKKLTDKRSKLYKAQNMLTREAREKAEQLYLTSEENSTYQLISKEFPEIPSTVRATLNRDAVQSYRNDAFDVKMGKKSIRSYRSDMPIPFDKKAMRFYKTDDGKEIGMHWLNDITFILNFGRDKSNNREIVERAMSGKYEYSNSKIQVADNKIFLLFCVDIPEEERKLDPEKVVGVNLGIVVPAYCAMNKGKARQAIGSYDDLFRVRVQMQERRRRLQRQLVSAKGGHGRGRKLQTLESLSEKERNFVRTYNHMISFQVIKFALKNKAGTINMELLEGYGEDERNKLILRNWSYFELHQMLEYKAKKFGIKINYTDPYRISQTCNCCGEYREDNLETRNDFVCKNGKCKNYGVKVFSDYNAALNNAQTLKFVSSKEECDFHNKHVLQES